VADTHKKNEIKLHYALYAGAAALITAGFLIIIKGGAWIASDSAAVLASLADSIIDAGISIMNFYAIRYSLKPADHEHRHGHGKVEGVAAMFQGAFIFGAGVFLIFESLSRFTSHEPVEAHMLSMVVMGVSVVASIALVFIQNYSLKHAPSLAVKSEKAHYSTDIILNGGVMLVLFLLYQGAPLWIDPVFALIVVAYLGKTAWDIVVEGLDMLLDRELPDNDRETILRKIRSHKEVKNVHDLRTRKSGMKIYMSFDMELDADKSLRDAHAISLEVEHDLLELYPNAEIMIHKDPYGVPHEESRHNVPGVHKGEEASNVSSG
jgi:ferrous-iron efflux pump FieF